MSRIVKFRMRFLVFAIIAACALSIVTPSSGISEFRADRAVKMRIADSGNAFIALPETIEMYVKTLNKEDKDDNNSLLNKQVADRDGIMIIECEFTVKNNLEKRMKLTKIDIEDPNIEIDSQEYTFEGGEQKNISVSGTVSYNNGVLTNNNISNYSAKAILHFEWDGGSSEIHKDVVIIFETRGKTKEKGANGDTIPEEDKGEKAEQEHGAGENTAPEENTGDNMTPAEGSGEDDQIKLNGDQS